MKNPMDMTLSEIELLTGERGIVHILYLRIVQKQKEIADFKVQEVKKLIKEKTPQAKPEKIFITEKELMDCQ